MKTLTRAALILATIIIGSGAGCNIGHITSVKFEGLELDNTQVEAEQELQISVQTRPREVDQVDLIVNGQVEQTVTQSTDDLYTFNWTAELADTAGVAVTARAWLGVEGLESSDTLFITVTPGPGPISVTLTPTDTVETTTMDSVFIEVTTEPARVDSVVLSGIDLTLTQETSGKYSTWYTPTDAGTYQVGATAWLGGTSLTSSELLILVIEEAAPYYPAKAGLMWTYNATSYDSTWLAFDSSSTVNDSTWKYYSECWGRSSLENGTGVWEVYSNGNFSYMELDKQMDEVNFYSDKTDSATVVTWPYTLEPGTTWYVNNDTRYEAIGYEDVTVPAGTYIGALKIQITPPEVENMTYEGYLWLDKHHGTVKSWYKTVTNMTDVLYMEAETTMELEEFFEG